jgi:hypothetical protein
MIFRNKQAAAATVQISNVELLNGDSELLKGVSVDGPAVESSFGATDFTICGWILPSQVRPLLSIEINVEGFQLKRIPINVPRPDVIESLNIDDKSQLNCGFDTRIGILGLPDDFSIELVAVFRGDNPNERVKTSFAVISGKKSTNLKTSTKYQPLMLTAIGRSGTTWVMKLLSQHPEVLTSDFYPFEVKQSAYWMQLLKLLTDPADFDGSSHPDKFDVTMNNIGHNPYTYPHYLNQYKNTDAFSNYYKSKHLNNVRDFSVNQIDEFYDLISEDTNKPKARYFAEKFVPTHLQSLYGDVYQAAKEIILVRDFRDVLCSAKSFNQKRNSVAFGRERVNDDFEWVQHVSKAGIKRMVNALRERRDTAFVLKYEDIILQPEKVLKSLFEYLNVNASEELVKQIISSASEVNASMDAHKTTKNPADSIGRWRSDMSPELQELCRVEMGPLLNEFGYSLD